MHRIGVVREHGRTNVDLLGRAFALRSASLAFVAAFAELVFA